MPVLIAIGLKQRPETGEIEEFLFAFRFLDGEEDQPVVKATITMLKEFGNDQAVSAAEKSSHMLKKLKLDPSSVNVVTFGSESARIATMILSSSRIGHWKD
jgi:hypothetical protein